MRFFFLITSTLFTISAFCCNIEISPKPTKSEIKAVLNQENIDEKCLQILCENTKPTMPYCNRTQGGDQECTPTPGKNLSWVKADGSQVSSSSQLIKTIKSEAEFNHLVDSFLQGKQASLSHEELCGLSDFLN